MMNQNGFEVLVEKLLSFIKERLIYILIVWFGLVPISFCLVAECISINPFLMVVEDILENVYGFKLSFVSYALLRIVCAIIFMNWSCEAFRIIPIIFICFLTMPAQIWVENSLLMRQIFFDNMIEALFLKRIYMSYKKSTIVQTVVSEFVEPETIFLTKVLLRFIPLGLFICMRMPGIFPLQLYIPVALVFTPTMIIVTFFLVLMCVKIYTVSVDNITSWEKAIPLRSRKELHMMYKTLRPLGFHAGIGGFRIECADDAFLPNLIRRIQNQTVELLIFFPESLFI